MVHTSSRAPRNYDPRSVELRRALFLFAIVLGLAAVVSIVTQPAERRRDRTTAEPTPPTAVPAPKPPPTANPRPDPGDAAVTIAPKDKTAKIETGTAATLAVAVDQPGDVALEGLGLTAAAEPATPARFDLLIGSPGRFRVLLTPSAGGEPRAIGRVEAVAKH